MRALVTFIVVLSTAAVAACASLHPLETPVPAPLLTADNAPAATIESPPSPDAIMALTPEMRSFLDRYVRRDAAQHQRMRELAEALMHPGLLGMHYSPTGTHTAAETFRTRSGNCVSLSLLFVAMAREIGLDARFQEVKVAPQWDRQSGVLLNFRHINVVGDLGQFESYTMDFKPQLGQRRSGTRRLSDAEAIAQFYNNRGADYLIEGRLAEAHIWYLRAIDYAPRLSFLWSNLALLYQRTGQRAEAERLLRYAIRLDSQNTSAISNLANLLEAEGRKFEAEDLLARARRAQQRNPYYLYAMAERAVDLGQHEEALRLLDRAIALKPEDVSFYELAARAARELQDAQRALSYQASADALTQASNVSTGPKIRL